MAQNYGVDITRWNGQDYDTILPTPDAHADTHKADGSDPLILQTGNYGDNTVTRDKLADDAKYSPVFATTLNSYVLSDNELGRTLTLAGNTYTIFHLSQSLSKNMPNGAEIAFCWILGQGMEIQTWEGIRVAIPGENNFLSNAKFRISELYSMVAFKKMFSDETNGDLWIVQGNVEVVS